MAVKIGGRKSGSLNVMHEMKKGEDGGYYIPVVDEVGNLSWEASEEDMPVIPGANIRGVQGDKGDKGDKGKDGINFIHIGEEEPTDPECLVWFNVNPESVANGDEVSY